MQYLYVRAGTLGSEDGASAEVAKIAEFLYSTDRLY